MDEVRTIDQMMQWRDGVSESMARHRSLVLRATDASEDAGARFVGKTAAEVRQYFEALRLETDRFVVLGLIAAGEAVVRRDYDRRVGRPGRKLKDVLSAAYRLFHGELGASQKERPPFDKGGILDELKAANVIDNQIVGRFRECLPARHWVAHGRYDDRPEAVDRFPPEVVYERVDALIRALPA